MFGYSCLIFVFFVWVVLYFWCVFGWLIGVLIVIKDVVVIEYGYDWVLFKVEKVEFEKFKWVILGFEVGRDWSVK